MKDFLARGDLDKARVFANEEPDHCETEVCFFPTIDEPGKIFCVGMNYADKRAEFAETNPAPTLFIRFAYCNCSRCEVGTLRLVGTGVRLFLTEPGSNRGVGGFDGKRLGIEVAADPLSPF